MDSRKPGVPELLAPAGDREKLEMALHYGADAVYLAGKQYGLRAFAGNFDPDGMKEAVEMSHAHGAAVYVTVNVLPHESELPCLPEYLEQGYSFVTVSELLLQGDTYVDSQGVQRLRETDEAIN